MVIRKTYSNNHFTSIGPTLLIFICNEFNVLFFTFRVILAVTDLPIKQKKFWLSLIFLRLFKTVSHLSKKKKVSCFTCQRGSKSDTLKFEKKCIFVFQKTVDIFLSCFTIGFLNNVCMSMLKVFFFPPPLLYDH